MITNYNVYLITDFDEDYFKFKVSANLKFYTGLCDYSGNVVIDPIYDDIETNKDLNFIILSDDPSGKLFIIKKEGLKNGFIDNKKVYFDDYIIVYDDDNDDIVYLIAEKKDKKLNAKKYIVFDKDGNSILESSKEINYCNNGMFLSYTSIIDEKGLSYIQYYFYDSNTHKYTNIDCHIASLVYNFYGGYARVNLAENDLFLMDTNIEKHYFDDSTNFYRSNTGNFTAIVKRKESSTYDVIDRDLNTLFSVPSSKFELESTFFDLFIITDKITKLKGIVDITGKIIIFCRYSNIKILLNGIIHCDDDYYDINGNKLNLPENVIFSNATEDTIIIEKDKKFAFIDSNGNILFNTWFDSYDDLKNNRVIVTKKEVNYETNDFYEYTSHSVLDLDGNVIFSYSVNDNFESLDYLTTLDHSYYVGKIKDSDEYILFDKDGKELKRSYSEIKPKLFKGYISFRENLHWNLYSSDGVLVFPAEFDLVNFGVRSDYRKAVSLNFINIINDRCLEYYKDGKRLLFIKHGNGYDTYDISRNIIKSANAIMHRLVKRIR